MTLAQLELANEIRLEQVARRRHVASLPRAEALQLVIDWLDDPDEIVARMRVGDLLRAIPRVQAVTAVKFLRRAGLNAGALNRRVKSVRRSDCTPPITLRARAALIDVLQLELERAKA